MEAVTEHLTPESTPSLPEAMRAFFARFDAEATYSILCFHLFKAWVCQPLEQKSYSDKEIALFCDQLISLVAAADQLHQTGRVNVDSEKGAIHD